MASSGILLSMLSVLDGVPSKLLLSILFVFEDKSEFGPFVSLQKNKISDSGMGYLLGWCVETLKE